MNVHVRELARQLEALDVAVDIFTRRSDSCTDEVVQLSDMVRVISIDAGPPTPMDKEDVFCVLPEFASEVALFSLRDGVRYDVVHSHYWLSGWAAHLLRRYWNTPVVHMYHTLAHMKNAVAAKNESESIVRLQVERRIAQVVDAIVAPNPGESSELAWRLNADASSICTIPPGIDLHRFTPTDAESARRRLGLPSGPLVLFVGRIDPIKGIDTLLEAFALIADKLVHGERPTLVFIGGTLPEHGGNDLQPILQRASELGIRDRIIFRGSVLQEQLPDYYAAATVAAVPSRYESFGLVAVEAMACGLPVVASNAGGMRFTIDDGMSGFLVPHSNPQELAAALHNVITDPNLRASLQVGARQAAIQFSWQSVAPAVLQLYRRVVAGNTSTGGAAIPVFAS